MGAVRCRRVEVGGWEIWVDRPIEPQDTAEQCLEHITQHISIQFEGAS